MKCLSILALLAFTGCAYIRIPVGDQHATYLRVLDKRTIIIADPDTGRPLFLSSSDGGEAALKSIATGIGAGIATGIK